VFPELVELVALAELVALVLFPRLMAWAAFVLSEEEPQLASTSGRTSRRAWARGRATIGSV
jgi:hypothetical protein